MTVCLINLSDDTMFFFNEGYSFLIDPRLCLIFETMEAISSSFSTTTIMSLSAKFGSTKTSATIQGLIAGIYYGLGQLKVIISNLLNVS